MSLLFPTYMLNRITDIDLKLLRDMSIDAILLDVDNTLAAHGSQEPFDGVLDWIDVVRKAGISIVIVSNNFKKRVLLFAKSIGLPFVSLSLKPAPFGFNRAKRLVGVNSNNIVVIGDQIFTDILGANLVGMKSILLDPVVPEKAINIRFKRLIEKPIRRKLSMSNNILK